MAKTDNLTDFLTSHANKFRSVLGTSGTIDPQDFDDLVDSTYTKGYNDNPGVDVSDTTAIADDVLSGAYFYLANGTKTQGNMTNNGSLGTTTLTASNSSKLIPVGYTSGGTVNIDTTNLLASNIKAGVSLLGLLGTFSDVTEIATANVTKSTIDGNFYFNAENITKPIKFIALFPPSVTVSSGQYRRITHYFYTDRGVENYNHWGGACLLNSSGSTQFYRYPGISYWSLNDVDQLSTGGCYVSWEGTSSTAVFPSGTYYYIIGA